MGHGAKNQDFPQACIGGDWRRNKIKKQTRGNQTAGNTEGERCKASIFDRHCAKSSRSYKHKNYKAWVEKTRLQNA